MCEDILNKKDERRIIKLREKFALSQEDLADIFDCSQGTIHNIFKRNKRFDLGRMSDKLVYKNVKDNYEEFRKQIYEGKNWWEVDLEISEDTLREYAKKFGVYKDK